MTDRGTPAETLWCIEGPDYRGGRSLISFTISYYRVDAIEKYCNVWSEKRPWRHHYNRGCRAVKVRVEKIDD